MCMMIPGFFSLTLYLQLNRVKIYEKKQRRVMKYEKIVNNSKKELKSL